MKTTEDGRAAVKGLIAAAAGKGAEFGIETSDAASLAVLIMAASAEISGNRGSFTRQDVVAVLEEVRR